MAATGACLPSVSQCRLYTMRHANVCSPETRPSSIIGGSCHKYEFCRDKSFDVFCCDKSMLVATKLCLSQQAYFCHDKKKTCFVATKVLFRQKYVCRNKSFVATKDVFCRDKHVFKATQLLLRQISYLWQLPPMILFKTTYCGGSITKNSGTNDVSNFSLRL